MHSNNKVLIVEDEEILAANIMTHIQRRGWVARIAPNGQQAVASLGDFVPQVILLDYHLPDMNGFQILDAICAAHGPRPCVLMTGHPSEHIMADAERHGIGRILCKPFALAEMESSLSSAVEEIFIPPSGLPVMQERRKNERRSLASRFFKAVRLGDGTWLTCDRRTTNRRH
ncbi:MAG: response regulator [Dechloromonas sp.]|nr:response regulator [Dechloromonas sp.]